MPLDDNTNPIDNPIDYPTLAERFFDLFASYQRAHGHSKYVFDVSKPGKRATENWTEKTAPTPELWEAHLTGSGPGLGCMPLRDDNTVLWAAIDIDVNTIDHAKLEADCLRLGLPLVVCRSKSGGAHCYLFLQDPAPAASVQAVLGRWSAALGYRGCEIFPKQATREGDDLGNWINMPYYIVRKTERPAFLNGKSIKPGEFLNLARERSTTLDAIEAIHVEVREAHPGQASIDYSKPKTPPTAEIINGVGDGQRNKMLWGLMCRFANAGIPKDMAERMIRETAAECDPPFNEVSERWDIKHNLERAYKKFAKDSIPEMHEEDLDAAFELECMDAGDDDGPIKPREWLLGNTFCKKFFSSLVATGGTGKTSLRIAQALALATGRPITGEYVFRRSRVLILTFEDDMEELKRVRGAKSRAIRVKRNGC